MGLVNVINISIVFPGKTLFTGLSFQIQPGDRIGLVGPNGSGKTTLLRLLNGDLQPESGEIVFTKGLRTGYLPQDIQEALSGNLIDCVFYSIAGRRQLEEKISRLETALHTPGSSEETLRLSHELTEAHQELAQLSQTYPRYEAEKILLGLGFHRNELSKPISSFSGGWKMRAALARLLYQKPDLLLLDEPTNHLDVPSVKWLEEFLMEFRGALVLVSHDREFLNGQIRRTISFEPEGIRIYNGNYEEYLKAREEQRRVLEAKAKNQEQKVKEAQRFIERFKAKASKARQAQSKIKLISKMEMVKTFKKEKTIRFEFPPVEPSGRVVFTLEGVSKTLGGNCLYSDINLTVMRGERIALIGPNGCGKTTLLKLLAGELRPDKGRVRVGHGVKIGYFAQHHSEMLVPERTVLEEVADCAQDKTIGFLRNVCGAFLFSGNDVEKPIRVLSGGEKARVLLAKLLVNPGNVMIMDEPTNHLDIISSDTLIEALAKYQGTLVFVSHNKYFINKLATKIWDVSGQGIEEYPGNLSEYNEHLTRTDRRPAGGGYQPPSNEQRPAQVDGTVKKRKSKKEIKRERAEMRRRIQEALNPIRSSIQELEDKISALEVRQREIEEGLTNPELFKGNNKGPALAQEYKTIKEALDKLLNQWEEQQWLLEQTKTRLGVNEGES